MTTGHARDEDELLQHLVRDHLWKAGIVTVAVVVVLIAMVIVYRRVGVR